MVPPWLVDLAYGLATGDSENFYEVSSSAFSLPLLSISYE